MDQVGHMVENGIATVTPLLISSIHKLVSSILIVVPYHLKLSLLQSS